MGDEKPRITLMCYDEKEFLEMEIKSLKDYKKYCTDRKVVWLNIDGICDDVLKEMCEVFSFHPLVINYAKNKRQRPTIKDFDDHLMIVMKMLYMEDKYEKVYGEHLTILKKGNIVISIQEKIGDVFNDVRERIREGRGVVRKMGADYLVYSLMDSIVNTYFHILEKLGEEVVFLEDAMIIKPREELFRKVHRVKINLIYLRKSIWPLREILNYILREEVSSLGKETRPYMYDLYDKVVQLIDSLETYREMITGMLDIYLTSISNKTNEIMKILTIISTIFIPLTFITGIYGMNFRYMPEIYWRWGYVFALLLMLTIAVIMLIFFRKKKWI